MSLPLTFYPCQCDAVSSRNLRLAVNKRRQHYILCYLPILKPHIQVLRLDEIFSILGSTIGHCVEELIVHLDATKFSTFPCDTRKKVNET